MQKCSAKAVSIELWDARSKFPGGRRCAAEKSRSILKQMGAVLNQISFKMNVVCVNMYVCATWEHQGQWGVPRSAGCKITGKRGKSCVYAYMYTRTVRKLLFYTGFIGGFARVAENRQYLSE